MTRFQKEITGQLGPFWQQNAEKEVQKAVKDAAENATVDANGAISWKSSGNYLPDEYCEKLEHAGFSFSREATSIAREAQVAAELVEYRKNRRAPSDAELREMRKTFGAGTTVVDIISGATIQL